MDHDAARLCRFSVCARMAPRRHAATALAVGAMSLIGALTMFVPGATARGRRCADAHTRAGSAPRRALQRAVVCLINNRRRAFGLPALRASRRLNASAQSWTDVMVDNRVFGHGADFGARISAAGFDWSNAGENIATGFRTPTGVVNAWMASTGHCDNILSPVYRYVGTGVSDSDIAGVSSRAGTWTQDFGLWMGQSAPSGNWAPAEGCPYR
jgi:uncharacterized protein YkwD